MSHTNVGQAIGTEVAAIEADPDAELRPDTAVTRPGRRREKVLFVRLDAKEYDELAAAASAAGVPPSRLARSFVLRQVHSHGPSPAELLERVERVERRFDSAS